MYGPHRVKINKIITNNKVVVDVSGFEFTSEQFYDFILLIIEKYKKYLR